MQIIKYLYKRTSYYYADRNIISLLKVPQVVTCDVLQQYVAFYVAAAASFWAGK